MLREDAQCHSERSEESSSDANDATISAYQLRPFEPDSSLRMVRPIADARLLWHAARDSNNECSERTPNVILNEVKNLVRTPTMRPFLRTSFAHSSQILHCAWFAR